MAPPIVCPIKSSLCLSVAGKVSADKAEQLLKGPECMQGLLLVGDLGIGNSPHAGNTSITMHDKAPTWGFVLLNVPRVV